jgi:hypothetical protein
MGKFKKRIKGKIAEYRFLGALKSYETKQKIKEILTKERIKKEGKKGLHFGKQLTKFGVKKGKKYAIKELRRKGILPKSKKKKLTKKQKSLYDQIMSA